jgi:prepilin-type N-terminal cleavage/methylation domain-containing protein
MAFGRSGQRGFTLVEMLVTLGIMTVVAAIAIPVFLSGRASSRRTTAENYIRAALASARDAAIEHRTTVAVEFDFATGVMTLRDKTTGLADKDRQLGAPIALPDHISFDASQSTLVNGWNGDPFDSGDAVGATMPDIAYTADGGIADAEGTTTISIIDTTEKNAKGTDLTEVLSVLPATGIVVEASHLEDPSQPAGPGNVEAKGWL